VLKVQRYFVNKQEQGRFIIEGEDRHHIIKVMRMTADEEIICVDPGGRSALCKIAEITDEAVIADIVKWNDETAELPVKVAIACGLPKGDKFEWIIQKGTEMGAHCFVPFAAARSVVKLDEKKSGKKVERWQKIAKEAAEQSHRNHVPEVTSPMDFQSLLKASEAYQFKLAAYEEESRSGETSVFPATLSQLKSGDSVFVVFGPEGGLSDKEVKQFKENNFKLCGLGPRILRAETAPLYVLAAISYHLELMR